jgi:MFS family permease
MNLPQIQLHGRHGGLHLFERGKRFAMITGFAARRGMATMFMSGLLLFPHYQSMAREMLGTSEIDIIWWVIAQNISVGILSPVFGMIADRRGNRIALRIAAFLAALTPLIAVVLASPWFPFGRELFWVTYVFLGITPVTMKTISNYTLELVPRDKHPQYLSTMTICYTVPFLLVAAAGSYHRSHSMAGAVSRDQRHDRLRRPADVSHGGTSR